MGRPAPVTDPVLGELSLSNDAESWECQVSVDGKTVGFKLGGQDQPDARLIAHARELAQSLPEFERKVSEFLANEARADKHLAPFANEVRDLTLEDICLFWPDRPDDGMLFFLGTDDFRVWRCDYVGRKLQGLGFDS